MDTPAIRFGGAFGFICGVTMLPRALIATFGTGASPLSVHDYFAGSSHFASATSILPMLHILFGLAFLGVLVAMLRQVAGPSAAVYTALAGGVVFFALTAGAFAAEVAYPMAAVRYGEVPIELNQPLMLFATWLYYFCQIGAAAMIFATSFIIWRTGVLPRWTAAGGVLGVVLLVPTAMPLPGGLPSLAWVILIGVVMFFAPGAPGDTPPPVDATIAARQD